jgi:hypothetical protein
MKLLSNKLLLVLLVLISGYGYIVSCTRDNDLIVPIQLNKPFVPSRGTNVHLPGNLASNPNEWKMDKTHSSVLWSTPYKGVGGALTGRFNQFGMHDITPAKMLTYATTGQPLKDTSWAFYENDPSKTYFNGYVQINTSNTGEPGRDGGCNVTGMNTIPIRSGYQVLSDTNVAKIKTTKVEFDPNSNGYIVTMDFTWHNQWQFQVPNSNPPTYTYGPLTPITKSVIGKLVYTPKSTPTGSSKDYFGLTLTFSINCRDFGITSTSIADKIDIVCNMNFFNN